MKKEEALDIVNEMVHQQKKKIILYSEKVVPHIIPDDLLQPQDYPELDFDPLFRYEEGLLHGLEAALAALRATL